MLSIDGLNISNDLSKLSDNESLYFSASNSTYRLKTTVSPELPFQTIWYLFFSISLYSSSLVSIACFC